MPLQLRTPKTYIRSLHGTDELHREKDHLNNQKARSSLFELAQRTQCAY